ERAVAFDPEGGSEFDFSALTRGEQALAELRDRFDGWMREAVDKLEDTRLLIHDDPAARPVRADFYRAAHDIRGHGATFGFPVIAQTADGLCDLLDGLGEIDTPALALIDAYVMAVRAFLREDVRETADRTVSELIAELAATRRAMVGLSEDEATDEI